MADTLRVYLERAGRLRERDALVAWVRAQMPRCRGGGWTSATCDAIRQHAWSLFTQGRAAEAHGPGAGPAGPAGGRGAGRRRGPDLPDSLLGIQLPGPNLRQCRTVPTWPWSRRRRQLPCYETVARRRGARQPVRRPGRPGQRLPRPGPLRRGAGGQRAGAGHRPRTWATTAR